MSNIFLGREPIVDNKNGLYAYEILYKDGKINNAEATRRSSASVISTVLKKFGTHSLLGNR